MQQSRLFSVLFALFAFSLFAFAAPAAGKDLVVARAPTGLDAVLQACLDLQVKIKASIAGLGRSFPSTLR